MAMSTVRTSGAVNNFSNYASGRLAKTEADTLRNQLDSASKEVYAYVSSLTPEEQQNPEVMGKLLQTVGPKYPYAVVKEAVKTALSFVKDNAGQISRSNLQSSATAGGYKSPEDIDVASSITDIDTKKKLGNLYDAQATASTSKAGKITPPSKALLDSARARIQQNAADISIPGVTANYDTITGATSVIVPNKFSKAEVEAFAREKGFKVTYITDKNVPITVKGLFNDTKGTKYILQPDEERVYNLALQMQNGSSLVPLAKTTAPSTPSTPATTTESAKSTAPDALEAQKLLTGIYQQGSAPASASAPTASEPAISVSAPSMSAPKATNILQSLVKPAAPPTIQNSILGGAKPSLDALITSRYPRGKSVEVNKPIVHTEAPALKTLDFVKKPSASEQTLGSAKSLLDTKLSSQYKKKAPEVPQETKDLLEGLTGKKLTSNTVTFKNLNQRTSLVYIEMIRETGADIDAAFNPKTQELTVRIL